MLRILVPGMVCFALSCGPHPQQSGDVYRVGAWDLVSHVRDHGDAAYRGQRVQVRVPARAYQADGCSILYYTGLPRTTPVIVFACHDPQPTETDAMLIVSGTVAGATEDGVRKADRVTFTIHVLDCYVTRVR